MKRLGNVERIDLRLSEIQIIPVKPHNGLLALVSFVLNDALYLGDVAVYSRLGQEGYRLVYPMRTLSNGAKVNIFHPIWREVSQQIEKQVSAAYRELVQKAEEQRQRRGEVNE